MTDYYNNIQIRGTDERRQPIRFRSGEASSKKKKYRRDGRIAKRKWLDAPTIKE